MLRAIVMSSYVISINIIYGTMSVEGKKKAGRNVHRVFARDLQQHGM